MSNKELIKVHRTITNHKQVGGEWIWAFDLGDKKARINNIPFYCDLNFDDIVMYNDDKEVVDVLTVGSHTIMGVYPSDKDEAVMKLRWEKIREHMKEHDIKLEGLGNGIFVMAVPLTMPYHKFQKIAKSCPVPIDLGPNADDEDDDTE